jgi:hypothetical protein
MEVERWKDGRAQGGGEGGRREFEGNICSGRGDVKDYMVKGERGKGCRREGE